MATKDSEGSAEVFFGFAHASPTDRKYHEEGNASAAGISPDRRDDHFPVSYSRALPDLNETIEFRRTSSIAVHLRLTKLNKSEVEIHLVPSGKPRKPQMWPMPPGMRP